MSTIENAIASDDLPSSSDINADAHEDLDSDEEGDEYLIQGTSSGSRLMYGGTKRVHQSPSPERMDTSSNSLSKRACLSMDTVELQDNQKFHRMEVRSIPGLVSCIHEVAIPPGADYIPLQPRQGPPLREYKFVLDSFQTQAILCIDNLQSVLVAAHTSAGKTVVAEYAIAKGLKNNQRVIYTSPIKALSNQKYREMMDHFQEQVGLMTGDITINPNASVLIMTTEILRSMLYRGNEIMREVGWVIFDEIHYMRDPERGVVWEETIILLPDKVRFVFLSATIPNAIQLAEWIAWLHKQPCHVVYTEHRPVPLQQYLYPAGSKGLYLIMDENRNFREANFATAMQHLQEGSTSDELSRKQQAHRNKSGQATVTKLVQMVMERNYEPVIVFSFNRRECEQYATSMHKMDFNTDEEKEMVDAVFKNAIEVLSPDERKLPQILNTVPLLKRGIGIHHSGLLPLIKETIELLFQEGLIKVLFATETFAMGLNMPARTVLFTSLRKFDGKENRFITSNEFIQMSGRAGRRGIDTRGIVLIQVDEQIPSAVLKNIVKGSADPLKSAFRLTYNMILNLLRVDGISPEYILERSFLQYQSYADVPKTLEEISKKKEELEKLVIPRPEDLSQYFRILNEVTRLTKTVQEIITSEENVLAWLTPGRLLRLRHNEMDFGWCPFLQYKKTKSEKKKDKSAENSEICLIVALPVRDLANLEGSDGLSYLKPVSIQEAKDALIIKANLGAIQALSSLKLYVPEDLSNKDGRLQLLKSLKEVHKRFPDGMPALDPVNHMKIKDEKFTDSVKLLTVLEARMKALPIHGDPAKDDLMLLHKKKISLEKDISRMEKEVKDTTKVGLHDELKSRIRVLKKLGYCNADGICSLKGRAACEISCADELLLTEMLFAGHFNDLEPAYVVSLLSCFVAENSKSFGNEAPKINERLSGVLRQAQEISKKIATVSKECDVPEEKAVTRELKPELMDICLQWCNGSSFAEICKSGIYEGTIVRCLRLLEELLRQMAAAAKVIGNEPLEERFTSGILKLKRDIIFAASLYL
ncbi:exosome RNA helicase MTR4-like [Paramacrobiotus metropolitanus]|uniref:exosome RNA helicase MTR4-like n=1 Tax=Paramacrobiotus metropolitanus TaxID=2943436 RepID=UPI002445829B|nr:exosome RNA helicase MTR4-like [Paramacrobiotus metropolitanus]